MEYLCEKYLVHGKQLIHYYANSQLFLLLDVPWNLMTAFIVVTGVSKFHSRSWLHFGPLYTLLEPIWSRNCLKLAEIFFRAFSVAPISV